MVSKNLEYCDPTAFELACCMGLSLDVPDGVQEALRVPEPERRTRLLIELACALYRREVLSFGKAAQLAGLGHLRFGLVLADREIPRNYTEEELTEDLAYARAQ
jgi:predicted HTH domain antitoxin